jgi:hypothetical protein
MGVALNNGLFGGSPMCLTMGFLQMKCRARMCARRLSHVTWVTAGTLQQDRFCFRCTWGPFKWYVGVERGRRPTNAGDQEHSRIIQLDRDLSTLIGLSPRATILSSSSSSIQCLQSPREGVVPRGKAQFCRKGIGFTQSCMRGRPLYQRSCRSGRVV